MRGEKAKPIVLMMVLWSVTVCFAFGFAAKVVAADVQQSAISKSDLADIQSLEDLLTIAIANSKEIMAAEYQLAAAQAGLQHVESALRPQLQATGSYSVANFSEAMRFPVDGTVKTRSGALTWAQQLGPNANLQVGLEKASIGLEQAVIQKDQVISKVIVAVQDSFHNVINAYKGVELAQSAQNNARRKVEITREQVSNGVANSVDLLKAENELRQAENAASSARSGLDTALLALLQTIGCNAELEQAREWAKQVIPTSFRPVRWEVEFQDALDYALAHRLDLALVQKQLEMAELDVDAVSNQRDWKVSLNGMTMKDDLVFNGSVDTERLLTATMAMNHSEGTQMAPTPIMEDELWQITAELSYRFGDGGAKKAQIAQAKAVLDSVRMQFEKLVDGVFLDVFAARENMLQAWRVYEQSVQALEQAKAVHTQLTQAHTFGSISEFELLEGALLVKRAENDVVAAGLNYESSKTRFALSMGVPADILMSLVSRKMWPRDVK